MPTRHVLQRTCRGRRPRPLLTLLVSLLCSLAVAPGHAADGALVMSARGEVIGAISGHGNSVDADARMVGAYGVVSARGYFADVLPSGEIGQVLSLVYASGDCSGAPAIEQSSVAGGPLPVPGYVFAFGAPARIFNVPAGATVRELVLGSEQQRGTGGFRCVPVRKRALVYPLTDNRAEDSGFANRYQGPLRIATKATSAPPPGASARAAPVAPPDESAPGADVPLDTPECAPGCFMPYLGDHICESECANSLCGFDAGDCSNAYVERAKQREAGMCAPLCDESSLGDGFCDSACNVAGCDYDHGDCRKP